jgi:UDP:flavonoid glycosyltransferase YjiC (YdhE family)
MGANMGHIDRLLLSARALRSRGHEVSFLLRDLSRAHPRIAAEGFDMGQAPVWLPQLANPPRLANYSHVLAAAGWLDVTGLAGLLSGWRHAFQQLRPDVLICDHAPTALLASRGLGMQVWAVGTSFEVPPRGAHFPAMASWEPAARARCATDDAQLLPIANRALALHGLAPLARLTDLFSECRTAIAGLPELAHYDGYGASGSDPTPFCGPTFVGDSGLPPQWPAGEEPRVFAYLDPAHAEFRALMAALRELPVRALVHAKGLSADAAQRLAGPRLRFEAQPLQLNQTLADADVVISHGGAGTVTAAVMAGKPQLAVTTHMEQFMTGRRLIEQKLGLATPPGTTGHDWPGLIRQLLDQRVFATNARALAQRHRGQTAAGTAERLADLIETGLKP